jgi:hypothetical protein
MKQKLKKRRLRKSWHRLRTLQSKRLLNTATQELIQLFANNKTDCIQTFLQGLTPTESTERRRPREWTSQEPFFTALDITRNLSKKQRRKKHAFAEHLANVFQPHSSENAPEEEEEARIQFLETPYQLEP